MSDVTKLACQCGALQMEVQGAPICVTECLCDSCRAASDRLERLEGSPELLTSYGATCCAEYRKDRLRFLAGQENLRDFRLTPASGTRRVVAICCNTPVFIEAKGGHWVSLYAVLWPEGDMPPVQLRTMVGDLADATNVPDDVPNHNKFAAKFMWRLLTSWVAMGFRNPKIETHGTLKA
ncbi:hypothetical protein KO498_03435 [Lentibacter algarum]|uniref:GFA family protein n=1 Tax=Lentibacter algarum TaxID=576131 RepID=UPI001C07C590|nr:DUF6151 family protein [Lentibacter algarum]MBU2980858.1 hypothetical protein [Lentibacter algarum]